MKVTRYFVTLVLTILFGSLPFVAMATIDVQAARLQSYEFHSL